MNVDKMMNIQTLQKLILGKIPKDKMTNYEWIKENYPKDQDNYKAVMKLLNQIID